MDEVVRDEDIREIILFGAGRDGREALDFFGADLIFGYVDNDGDRLGATINGKKIISIYDLKAMLDDSALDFESAYEVVITIGVTKWAMFTVAQQLRKIGIEKFSVYSDIKKRWKSGKDYISRDIEKYPCEQESVLEIYKYQLDWMIRHTNAADLKPAVGKMRESQIKSLTGLKWLLKKTESLNLKFIMNHGTLIGALRHGGFIPWDDDMDLALIGEQYERFIQFCEEDHEIKVFYNCYKGEYKTKEGETQVSIERYPYIMTLGWGYVQFFRNIGKENCKENELITDIMPLYYVDDNVTLEQYISEHNQYTKMRKEYFDRVDEIYIEGKYNKEMYVEISNQVGYPFDFTSFFDYLVSATGRTMQRTLWRVDDLYPLQKSNFEDLILWMPKNPEAWLKQINPEQDIMAIPLKSVGIPVHNKDDVFTEKY